MSPSFEQVLARGGHSGDMIAKADWSQHTLGPIDSWPAALKNALSICLASKSPILVWWGEDLTNLIEFYNDAYRPVLGETRHARSMGALGSAIWPAVWHLAEKIFGGVLSAGQASEHKDSCVFLDRHGFDEESYFDHAHSPLYSDDGRISGVFSTVQETTARVLGERRLRTLKSLAELASTARDVRRVCRDSAERLYENAADIPFCLVYSVSGRSYELLGSGGLDANSARAAHTQLPLTEALESGRPVVTESSLHVELSDERRKAPQQACVLPIRCHPQDPPIALLVAGLSPHLRFDETYRDFLELASSQLGAAIAHARAERSARVQEPLLIAAGSILRQAPVAIALLRGPDFVFELANERCERMLGSDALIGKPMREVLTPLRTAEAPAILQALAHVRDTGELFCENEFPVTLHKRSDSSGNSAGGQAYFMFTCQPLHPSERPADWIVAVAIDVTKQIELRRELENMSREREQLLLQEQDARAGAEAANRVKDEFLAVLGHELRNPLAPITTALALMRHRAPLEHETLIIERQVGHLKRLVEDLLDVSRITRGRVELKRRPLNMAQVVREAIELASPLLEEREQHLSVDVPASGLEMRGDRTRLAQVFTNLLTNASKYSERGAHIIVRGARLPELGMLEISVRDYGIGIEPEMLPAVWNAFKQGAQAIDRSHGGLGLGLTIVRSLVALHGGTVAAHSDGAGQGSEFLVRLPLWAEDRAEMPEPHVRPTKASIHVFAGCKVLLVDDNEDAVELLAEWFRSRGASVETALDGLTALEVAKVFEPDVALLDLGLPAMSGYEVARRLRAREAHRHTVLIAVTGYGEQSARAETSAAGFDDHCVKPLDLKRFEARLRDKLTQIERMPRSRRNTPTT